MESPQNTAPEAIKKELKELCATFKGGKILLPLNGESESIYQQNYMGTEVGEGQIELDPMEALLLMERERIAIKKENSDEIMNAEELIEWASERDPDFWQKYLVFRDLRRRGYIVRKGYGNGIDFRLFPRGSSRSKGTAKYFVVIIAEGNPVYFQYFDSITQQAIKSRKELLLAIVDRLGDVTYYKLEQMKFNVNPLREGVDL